MGNAVVLQQSLCVLVSQPMWQDLGMPLLDIHRDLLGEVVAIIAVALLCVQHAHDECRSLCCRHASQLQGQSALLCMQVCYTAPACCSLVTFWCPPCDHILLRPGVCSHTESCMCRRVGNTHINLCISAPCRMICCDTPAQHPVKDLFRVSGST